MTFLTCRDPYTLHASPSFLKLYVGRYSGGPRLKIVEKKPRDLRDWATAWRAERAFECSLHGRVGVSCVGRHNDNVYEGGTHFRDVAWLASKTVCWWVWLVSRGRIGME